MTIITETGFETVSFRPLVSSRVPAEGEPVSMASALEPEYNSWQR